MSLLNRVVYNRQLGAGVFECVSAAKEAKAKHGAENVIDATIGALYGEDGNQVFFKSVWSEFDKITALDKSKYASDIDGGKDYKEAVRRWLFGDLELNCGFEVVATAAGTGAISNTLNNTLDPYQLVIFPSLGWPPYNTIAKTFNLGTRKYNLFNENDVFDIEHFKKTCRDVAGAQEKIVAVINDPCHNPSGYSMTDEEWDEVINFLEDMAKTVPVVLLNDIAYMDYSASAQQLKNRFKRLGELSENLICVLAFSTSKTFTNYGMRVGAQVILSKDKEMANKFAKACTFSARGTWGTVSNSGMKMFSSVVLKTDILKSFISEKFEIQDILRQRHEAFNQEACKYNIDFYPHKEGFFVTVRFNDNDIRDKVNEDLRKLNVFGVPVNLGLRIGLCSITIPQSQKLPEIISQVIEKHK